MGANFKVPRFASEAEEAEWWYSRRDDLIGAFEDAARQGELRTGPAARQARYGAAEDTSATTIRLDPDDTSRARELAAKRGLGYQTYLKMLLHEALAAEEKKHAS